MTVILGALNRSVPCFLFKALMRRLACDPPRIIFPPLPPNERLSDLAFIRGLTPSPIPIFPGRLGTGLGKFRLASGLSGILMIVSRDIPVAEWAVAKVRVLPVKVLSKETIGLPVESITGFPVLGSTENLGFPN